MPQFTQLNLQAKSPEKAPGKADSDKQHHSSGKKVAAFVSSLAASALLGVVIFQSSGCSKGNDRQTRAAIASPAVPTTQEGMPAAVALSTAPAMEKKATPKKSRQHKLSAAKYANAEYGVSFSYPKSYNFLPSEDSDIDWAGVAPAEMNFVEPGGAMLAAVELPQSSYPGTDFAAGYFDLSVNSKLSQAQCEQFAFPQDKAQTAASATTENQPGRVKLGAAEFTEVEAAGGELPRKADTKYYHLFQNGTCYEFALGLETTAGKITDRPVNPNEVFRKLNWMLSTVKIESPAARAAAASDPTAAR